ncbi:RluA family pseudouridine synthase [Parachlamydia sp. AcF125]|uniref:RluA family pseudouridine synthase n=1 Tax=Parachlamydia sp. AcF125 TaxID=2795736 RepID=UPI001BC9F592|nr:RluA family pseudouridine synthase [Parachlamydia sp. AcF125]MBS4169129.1 Ribosomal large subunit pseudouridine synthase D [Parachlamydia sp. AcF125]
MKGDEIEEGASFLIQDTEVRVRLDKVLAARYKNNGSRTYFQMLIEKGLVLLNGEPVKKRFKPNLGDEVELFFAAAPEIPLIPQPIPLHILYEDDYLLIVDKPAGMVVHPAPGNWTGTFVNALLYHCGYSLGGASLDSLRPGIVHRLDKETSGVLVAAKTLPVQQKLMELFANRQVYKEYWAICLGNPGNCELKGSIGRHPVHRKQMTVREDGKEALTLCETLEVRNDICLVRLVLSTGRTHQIRVHLKHAGHPILGDSIYGNKQVNLKYRAERQMLHARKIAFSHPITHQKIVTEAPLPPDMEQFLKKRDMLERIKKCG